MHTEYRKSSENNVYGMYVMESRIFEPYHEAHRMCAGITYFEPYRDAHRICTCWNHAFLNLFKWLIVYVLESRDFEPYHEAHRMCAGIKHF